MREAAASHTERCCSALMRDHAAISARVRPQPTQTFCASSRQILMQGDATLGLNSDDCVMGENCVELWGWLAYSSNGFAENNA
jgi:hypothetical protein